MGGLVVIASGEYCGIYNIDAIPELISRKLEDFIEQNVFVVYTWYYSQKVSSNGLCLYQKAFRHKFLFSQIQDVIDHNFRYCDRKFHNYLLWLRLFVSRVLLLLTLHHSRGHYNHVETKCT